MKYSSRIYGASLLALALLAGCDPRPASEEPDASSQVTFTRDIAPLVFSHCAPCHRPGASGPFPLLSYRDVARRAEQIALVTGSRFMPPWLPAPGYGEFVGQRRLSAAQIALFQQWAASGTPEGNAADLPSLPTWTENWQLGEPDLVIELPQPYLLPAEGLDAFRNFVLPVEVPETRYVRAFEFIPGNPRVVHHAIIQVDYTRMSRHLDAADPGPGFGGMDMGSAEIPAGHFLGWTPGKVPDPGVPDMSWRLERGSDLVLQLHMLPSGKPEAIQPRIGLYFAAAPPTRIPFGLVIFHLGIDIPAGASAYQIEDTYELPVDVEVLGVYPHAHYVGKKIHGLATLPDGTRQWLIRIDDWDFNWQDDYRYVQPLFLPRGTTLKMHYTYDNSAANERNPNVPPRRVVEGNKSTDEMGTLTLLLLPRHPGDLEILKRDYELKFLYKTTAYYEEWVKSHPGAFRTHNFLGESYLKLGRFAMAAGHLEQAISLEPDYADAHHNLGKVLRSQGRHATAIQHYRRALKQAPYLGELHVNLANALATQGDAEQAIQHYRQALGINPDQAKVQNNLGNVLKSRGRYAEAIEHYRRALGVDPSLFEAHINMGNALALQGDLEGAIEHLQTALEMVAARPNRSLSERLRRQLEIYRARRPEIR